MSTPLQHMHLSLQRYAMTLRYKPGKELFLAHAWSRFPSKIALEEETEQFQVNVLDYVSVPEQRLKTLCATANKNAALVIIHEYIEMAWPDNK